jgi:ABC-type oligopeptide transport system substrate-binding subunit
MKNIVLVILLIALLSACASSGSGTPQTSGYPGNYKGSFTIDSQTIGMSLNVVLSNATEDIYSGVLKSLKNGNQIDVTCSSLKAGEFSCYRFTGSNSFLMQGQHNGKKWSGTVADGVSSGTFTLTK